MRRSVREIPLPQRLAFSLLLLAAAMEVGWPLIRQARPACVWSYTTDPVYQHAR